jgi:hypothetical protein
MSGYSPLAISTYFYMREEVGDLVAIPSGSIFKSLGIPSAIRMWDSDGKLQQLIESLPKLGINAITSFDPWTDISQFKAKIGAKVCLIGNIDPIRVLTNGTREQIEREVKWIIDIGKPNGDLLSGPAANYTMECRRSIISRQKNGRYH